MGPNRAGPVGLLQPLADGVKLIVKETIRPTKRNEIYLYLFHAWHITGSGALASVFWR